MNRNLRSKKIKLNDNKTQSQSQKNNQEMSEKKNSKVNKENEIFLYDYNSDDEEYLPEKYPTDYHYEKALKNFNISSQDKREAGQSKYIKETDLDFNNYETKNIMKILIQMKESMDYINFKFEKIREENNILQKVVKDFNQIKEENNMLKKKISEMSLKINNIEQENKNKNIILSGIEQTQNENLQDIVITFLNKIDVRPEPADIENIQRLGNKNKENPILVELKNKNIKNYIIKKRKEKGIIYAEELGMKKNYSNNKRKIIYINDDLTIKNQELLKKARIKKKCLNYQYVWTKNGTIFMRKTKNSIVKIIQTEEDLPDF